MTNWAGSAGVIIECKTAESEDKLKNKEQEALQQIQERDYGAEFRAQNATLVLHYGVAFGGNHMCRWK